MNLSDARLNRIQLRRELDTLLSNPDSESQEITVARGRYIRALNIELRLEPDPTRKTRISNVIQRELSKHKLHLNQSLQSNKTKASSVITQVPEEFGLKIRKLMTNINQIKYSRNIVEGAASIGRVAGGVVSTAVTTVKAPIVGTLKLGSAILPTLGKIVVQPLQIPGFLFSKLFKPHSPYNGSKITKMGSFLGTEFGKLFNTLGNGVKKL